MKPFVKSLLLALICLSSALAFTVRPAVQVLPVASSSATALNVFGNRKNQAQQEEENNKYWQGEWVCKDCGYIYNRVR